LKTCLVNLLSGDVDAEHAITRGNHARYAQRIGVPHVVMHIPQKPEPDRAFPLVYANAAPCLMIACKFEITRLFSEYERLVFLDLDTVVTRDCPNILDFVPTSRCGFVDEFSLIRPTSRKYHHTLITQSGHWPLMWFYANSGVMVLPAVHAGKYKFDPSLDHQNAFDQNFLGLACQKDPNSYVLLDRRFNHNYMMRDIFLRDMAEAWIIHTAGYTLYKTKADRCAFLKYAVQRFGL
jgi:lipopolysaccharide biosynthesis glycosyltransferase